MKPLILINFKNYKEAMGSAGISLAQQLCRAKISGYHLALAPPLLDLWRIKSVAKVPLFAQHADAVEEGAFTGRVAVKELQELGMEGVILNHSERKLSFEILKQTRELCKNYRLKTMICASTLAEVKKVLVLKPEYVAYEPAEFIGGDISVTKAKPEILTKVITYVRWISPGTIVLCGAGIHHQEDVHTALKLGTGGVLLAHAVVKAKEPKEFLEKLLG